MLPSNADILACQERYKDLLREAERERLVRATGLYPTNKRGLRLKIIGWLRTQLMGVRLEASRRTAHPTSGFDCD